LLFLEVDQRELSAVSSAVEKLLGDKAIVSSEIAIQKRVGGFDVSF
jgi:hypothetical protein